MKTKYCRWEDEEIKQLFNFIKDQVLNNVTRAKAFSLYADTANRKANSVRNYYYLELAYLQNNPAKAQKLGIDLKAHQKQTPNYFSSKETLQCMEDIERLVRQGNSVRKACLILSDGNIDQMVRLQNKYRSLQKKKQDKKTEAVFENNIISMPMRSKALTEQEINSLFLGLLKLIKANAKQESLAEFAKKTQDANNELRKTLLSLNQKEKELKKLRENFELLKQENSKAKETILILRTETASLLANTSQKIQDLKTYAGSLKPNASKTKNQTN